MTNLQMTDEHPVLQNVITIELRLRLTNGSTALARFIDKAETWVCMMKSARSTCCGET
jgi:hypothetical protein